MIETRREDAEVEVEVEVDLLKWDEDFMRLAQARIRLRQGFHLRETPT
jgi:hypothetical protein